MVVVLAAAGPGGAASKELCSAAQVHLLGLAAAKQADDSSRGSNRLARLVVPSTALVQGTLRSLAAAGALAQVAGASPARASGAAATMAAASAAAEGEPTAAAALQGLAESGFEGSLPASLDSVTSASGSGGGSGALDQEYGGEGGAAEPAAGGAGLEADEVQPHTPVSLHAASALALPASGATQACSGGSGRRSFERRRQQRQAAAGAAESRPAASASGSDSELDPAADSVAANLCRMDSPSPVPPRAAAQRVAPAPAPSSAPTSATAAALGSPHLERWLLGHPERVVLQLAGRLEAFTCL